MNKVQLIGHLGLDPEVTYMQNGDSVVTLRVATNKRWKDKEGNSKEKTEWHRVVCFKQGLNKVLADYLKKGSHLYLEGELHTRSWTDKEKIKRYTTEIYLNNFEFLDKKDKNIDAPADDVAPNVEPDEAHLNEDIPF